MADLFKDGTKIFSKEEKLAFWQGYQIHKFDFDDMRGLSDGFEDALFNLEEIQKINEYGGYFDSVFMEGECGKEYIELAKRHIENGTIGAFKQGWKYRKCMQNVEEYVSHHMTSWCSSIDKDLLEVNPFQLSKNFINPDMDHYIDRIAVRDTLFNENTKEIIHLQYRLCTEKDEMLYNGVKYFWYVSHYYTYDYSVGTSFTSIDKPRNGYNIRAFRNDTLEKALEHIKHYYDIDMSLAAYEEKGIQ